MRFISRTTKSSKRGYITANAFEFLKNSTAKANIDMLSYLFVLLGAGLISALFNYSEKRDIIILLIIILILLRYIIMDRLLQKN